MFQDPASASSVSFVMQMISDNIRYICLITFFDIQMYLSLKYSLNQEKYLKVFLDNPNVPIDNSASERAIRTFCLGKKNWMFHNTANGANSSALDNM